MESKKSNNNNWFIKLAAFTTFLATIIGVIANYNSLKDYFSLGQKTVELDNQLLLEEIFNAKFDGDYGLGKWVCDETDTTMGKKLYKGETYFIKVSRVIRYTSNNKNRAVVVFSTYNSLVNKIIDSSQMQSSLISLASIELVREKKWRVLSFERHATPVHVLHRGPNDGITILRSGEDNYAIKIDVYFWTKTNVLVGMSYLYDADDLNLMFEFPLMEIVTSYKNGEKQYLKTSAFFSFIKSKSDEHYPLVLYYHGDIPKSDLMVNDPMVKNAMGTEIPFYSYDYSASSYIKDTFLLHQFKIGKLQIKEPEP